MLCWITRCNNAAVENLIRIWSKYLPATILQLKHGKHFLSLFCPIFVAILPRQDCNQLWCCPESWHTIWLLSKTFPQHQQLTFIPSFSLSFSFHLLWCNFRFNFTFLWQRCWIVYNKFLPDTNIRVILSLRLVFPQHSQEES